MIIFFNDTFLEDEYFDYDEQRFHDSLEKFIEFSDVIVVKRQEYSQRIYFKADDKIKGLLAEQINTSVSNLFLETLNRLNVKFWNSAKNQRDNFDYYFFDTSLSPPASLNIRETSLAEASEIKRIQGASVLTLNLPDLKFTKIPVIHVNIISQLDRQDVENISVDCADCKDSLGFWIDKVLSVDHNYSNFDRPPLDKETCLINQFKFDKVTGKRVQGRQVYKDKSNKFWYVDNFHSGEAAHIEVFNEQGIHEGESSLEGLIDYSKRDPNKTMDVS